MNDIGPLIDSLNAINITLQKDSGAFWNSQLFAALIGAISATIISLLVTTVSSRKARLNELYDKLIDNIHWYTPEALTDRARSTSYGHTSTRNGVTTVVPEKTLAEKTVIEFRKRCKHWKWPFCYTRFLFWRYEKALNKIQDIRATAELKESKEYQKTEVIYKKIVDLIEGKTGENQWTNR